MAIRLLSSENITGSITTAAGQSISNAGKIIMQSDGTLDWGGAADYGNLTWDTGKAIIAGLSGKALEFRTNGSSIAFTLDTSQNATFESSVTTGGTILVNNVGADKKIAFRRTSANNWSIEHDASQLYFYNETSSKDILLMKNGGQLMLGEYGSGTFTGTTAYTLAVDSSGNIIETIDGGGTVKGTGTATRVAFWSASDTISSNADLYWDNSNSRLGIGLTNPDSKLYVKDGNIKVEGNATDTVFLEGVKTGTGVTTRIYNNSNGTYWDSYAHSVFRANQLGGSGGSMVFMVPNEAMRITSNSNVGIGTNSPSAKLHVNGVVTANDSIQVQNDDSGFICRNAAGTVIGTIGAESSSTPNIGMFTVRNNGNNKIVLNSNGDSYFIGGDVAIGTTSPDAPLSIHGGTGLGIGASGLRVHRPDSFGQFGFFDYGQSSGTTYIGSSYTGGSAANYGVIAFRQLSNGGAAKDTMVISTDNKVGIGTTSPAQTLEVVNSGFAYVRTRSTAGSFTGFDIGQHTGGGIFLNNRDNTAITLMTNNTTHVTFNADRTTTFAGNVHVDVINNAANSANIIYRSGTSTLVGGGSSGNKLYVLDSGSVGIGTSSPNQKLEVAGRIRVTTDPTLEVYEASNKRGGFQWDSTNDYVNIFSTGGDMRFDLGGERMRITSAGNVGIGYTSPGSKLSVNGDGGFVSNSSSRVLYLTQQAVDSGNIIQFLDQSGNNVWELVGRNNQFYIYNNNVGQHSIYVNPSTNNVSIKQVTSSYSLDVNGSIRASADVIAYSDRRVKENIKTIDNSLEKVNKLRGVEFNKIGEDKKSIGVIAQEIEKILPEVVRTDDEGMKSVAYGNITGVLIEAIKDLKQEIEELKKLNNGN